MYSVCMAWYWGNMEYLYDKCHTIWQSKMNYMVNSEWIVFIIVFFSSSLSSVFEPKITVLLLVFFLFVFQFKCFVAWRMVMEETCTFAKTLSLFSMGSHFAWVLALLACSQHSLVKIISSPLTGFSVCSSPPFWEL